MARSAAVSIENAFTRGLITEVTGVNSPENSVTETTNVIYDRRGRAFPRKGFDFELGHVQQPVVTPGVRNEFLWETVSDNNNKTFVVIQFGSFVRFFEASSSAPLSQDLEPFFVNLLDFKVPVFTDVQVQDSLCSFTAGKGYLFIAHPNCDTIYVKYDQNTNSISVNRVTVQIRDFQGVEDGLAVDQRPNFLTNEHRYNLLNQGWYADGAVTTDTSQNVLAYWDSQRGDFPSNMDVWWYYLIISQNSGKEILQGLATTVNQRTGLYGNTPAAKGHYIVNAFQTNRSALSGTPVPEESSGGFRPSVVAFYAGRAFYAGVGSSNFSSTIYFTQIVEEDEQLNKCYQANDPTSRETFDLLPTDGGTIKIQDINTIFDMRVIGQSLYIFASNGVWSVSGTDNTPFRATDYTVTKISSFPAISKTSIVDVGGFPMWWNYEGIFTIQKDQTGFSTGVNNLSQTTIQTFYDAIPQISKLTAKGAFNDQEGIVYWLYNLHPENGTFNYTHILVFDVISTAFYPLAIPETVNQISGLVAVRSIGINTQIQNVTDNFGVQVTNSLGQNVTISVETGYTASDKTFKFITINNGNVSFSEMRSETYLDWPGSLNLGYETSFVTGYRIRGDLLKEFQANYLTVITESVVNGSCYVQAVWDYTTTNETGLFSNPQQVYRYFQRAYQRAKLKMRGSGYSMQLKFFGEQGRPFIIVGWASFDTSNGLP